MRTVALGKRIVPSLNARGRRFRNYYYHTAKPKWVNPISIMRQVNERKALRRIKAIPELDRVLRYIVETSGSTGCSYSDYWELYSNARRIRPQYALECGSGISSGVIATALKHNSEENGVTGVLISMEELDEYHSQIKNIMPSELLPFVEFRKSPRIVKEYGTMQGLCYRSVPPHPYRFVFVDGPNNRSPITGVKLFNSDIVDVVAQSQKPVFGIVDQRIMTMWALKKLSPTVSIRYVATKALTFVDGATQTDLLLPPHNNESTRPSLASRTTSDNNSRS